MVAPEQNILAPKWNMDALEHDPAAPEDVTNVCKLSIDFVKMLALIPDFVMDFCFSKKRKVFRKFIECKKVY